MKKEIWQDALNEIDEKFAEEYAGILQKDAEQAVSGGRQGPYFFDFF